MRCLRGLGQGLAGTSVVLSLLFSTRTSEAFSSVPLDRPPAHASLLFSQNTPPKLDSSSSALTATVAVDADAADTLDTTSSVKPTIGTVGFLLPSNAETKKSKFGQYSPVEEPSLLDAAQHLAKKSFWFSEGQVNSVIATIGDGPELDALLDVDVLIVMGLESSENDLQTARQLFQHRKQQNSPRQCQFVLDCSNDISKSLEKDQFCGPFNPYSSAYQKSLAPWTGEASGQRLQEQMKDLFDKWTSDDFALAVMLFFNRFSGSTVDWVKDSVDATWEKGPVRNAKEFVAMATKCGDCIGRCLQDEKCAECLNKLTELDTRDQATSYRTIVSYESELLKDFSYCILQKVSAVAFLST